MLDFGLISHFINYYILNVLKERFTQSNWIFPLRIDFPAELQQHKSMEYIIPLKKWEM